MPRSRVYSLPWLFDTLGVIHITASRFKFPPCVDFRSAPGLRPSWAFGVAHSLAASAMVGLSVAPADADLLMRSWPVSGGGHIPPPCEAEPPCAPMAGAHIGRGKSDPFRVPPAVGQFSHDAGGGAFFEIAFGFVHSGGGGSSDGADVLQNESCRTAIVGDVEDVEEQARPLAIKPGAASGDADVLAREASNQEIHASAPSCAVEGEQVRPDRRRIKGSRFHKAGKLRGCSGFPFHVANGSVLNAEKLECGADSFSKHADSGAEFDGM